tara:strand:+ start:68 stop:640 length:573 start_codon:yes stop_codon:yes gene_type:complete
MSKKFHNLNFLFFLNLVSCISFYFLTTPVFPQTEENTNLLNSNEEIRAEYGNWIQVCQKENDKCVGVQFALNVDGNRAARFIIERLNESTDNSADSLITIFVPFESIIPILPNGIKLIVDSKDPFSEQFLFCDQLGCTSQFGLTKQGIDLFLAGANLSMFMIDVRDPNNKFIVDIDLEDFQTIYNNLKTE